MTEDPRSTPSRLPNDAAYWNRLADRIVARGTPLLEDYRAVREVWWAPVARRSPWLAAAAVVAVIAGWLALPPASGEVDVRAALTPPDPWAGIMLAADGPPSLERLLGWRGRMTP